MKNLHDYQIAAIEEMTPGQSRLQFKAFDEMAKNQKPVLPEHIWRDDVLVLREEIQEISAEIERRLAQAQAAGFDTKGW